MSTITLLSHHTVAWGIVSLLCLFVCVFLGLFFLYCYGFLSGGKRQGREILHSCSTTVFGQVFSHFGELWLAWRHSGGITSGISYIVVAVGQSELGVVIRWTVGIGGVGGGGIA